LYCIVVTLIFEITRQHQPALRSCKRLSMLEYTTVVETPCCQEVNKLWPVRPENVGIVIFATRNRGDVSIDNMWLDAAACNAGVHHLVEEKSTGTS